MTNRPDIEELLGDYIEGTLDPSRRGEVEQILAADPELRKSVQQMMQARDTLRSLPVESLPPEKAGEIRRAITDPPARRWIVQFSPMRLAAALLLSATAALVIWSALPRESAGPIAANVSRHRERALAKSAVDADDAALLEEAGQPPVAAEAFAQATPADGNQSVLMFVRSSDIPAVEREIQALFGAASYTQTATNAMPDMAELPAPAATSAPPTRGLAEKQELADVRREAKAESAPMAIGAPAAPMPGIVAEKPAEIRLSDITPEQVQLLQRNVAALRPSNEIELVAAGPGTSQQQPVAPEARQQLQQQMLRSMPSPDPTQLQQFARMRQQQDFAQAAPTNAARYDLTIILQPQTLPPAAGAATLPATAPQQRPQTP